MTAVEWLAEQMMHPQIFNPYIEQAKELEKQQIMEAFQYKFFHPYVENEPEIYYDETYKPSA
jgi:hypothetical protein